VKPDETSPPNAPGAPKALAAPVVATARTGVPTPTPTPPGPVAGERTTSFADDFRRFFFGGLKTLLPTLITLWLLFWIWNFLWENIGRHVIWAIKWLWITMQEDTDFLPRTAYEPAGRVRQILNEDSFGVRLLGVGLAILLVYIVGVFVGNLLGRAAWRLVERNVMRLPLIRAIYPSVKQVTDFLLADRSGRAGAAGGGQFQGSRVVAVQARNQGVWSIGLVTNKGYGPLNEAIRGEMLTVFIPSSPTAVAGYVVVAHREDVVELPLTVEEALRLLVSGGVLLPNAAGAAESKPSAADLLPGAGAPSSSVPAEPGAPAPAADRDPSRSMRTSTGNPSAV
jgi:uncharacterized membrane protein